MRHHTRDEARVWARYLVEARGEGLTQLDAEADADLRLDSIAGRARVVGAAFRRLILALHRSIIDRRDRA